MDIEQEINKINEEIINLAAKKNDLISRYISDNGLKKVIENIRNSTIENKIESFYFNDEDFMYVIKLSIPDKNFESRLAKKHRIIKDAFKGIEDEFIIKHIRITGAII